MLCNRGSSWEKGARGWFPPVPAAPASSAGSRGGSRAQGARGWFPPVPAAPARSAGSRVSHHVISVMSC